MNLQDVWLSQRVLGPEAARDAYCFASDLDCEANPQERLHPKLETLNPSILKSGTGGFAYTARCSQP